MSDSIIVSNAISSVIFSSNNQAKEDAVKILGELQSLQLLLQQLQENPSSAHESGTIQTFAEIIFNLQNAYNAAKASGHIPTSTLNQMFSAFEQNVMEADDPYDPDIPNFITSAQDALFRQNPSELEKWLVRLSDPKSEIAKEFSSLIEKTINKFEKYVSQ